jgi:hypothetical protein
MRAIVGTMLVLAGVVSSGAGAAAVALPMTSDSTVSAIAIGLLIGAAVVGVIGVGFLCSVPRSERRL